MNSKSETSVNNKVEKHSNGNGNSNGNGKISDAELESTNNFCK